jgi:hypothetical protein
MTTGFRQRIHQFNQDQCRVRIFSKQVITAEFSVRTSMQENIHGIQANGVSLGFIIPDASGNRDWFGHSWQDLQIEVRQKTVRFSCIGF